MGFLLKSVIEASPEYQHSEELFAHNLLCGREPPDYLGSRASMQSSTNCSMLRAKGDSCHLPTQLSPHTVPKTFCHRILELEDKVATGLVKAMADEQGCVQSRSACTQVEQAVWAASAHPSLQILHPVPAMRHGCSAASVGCMGVEEEKDMENPT